MATLEQVAEGLVSWLNTINVTVPVSSVAELTDGKMVWKALRTAYMLDDRAVANKKQNASTRLVSLAGSRNPTHRNGYSVGRI